MPPIDSLAVSDPCFYFLAIFVVALSFAYAAHVVAPSVAQAAFFSIFT
jgi:hypothetical protein